MSAFCGTGVAGRFMDREPLHGWRLIADAAWSTVRHPHPRGIQWTQDLSDLDRFPEPVRIAPASELSAVNH